MSNLDSQSRIKTCWEQFNWQDLRCANHRLLTSIPKPFSFWEVGTKRVQQQRYITYCHYAAVFRPRTSLVVMNKAVGFPIFGGNCEVGLNECAVKLSNLFAGTAAAVQSHMHPCVCKTCIPL